MSVPPKVLNDMKEIGGRHYKGRGLGRATGWKCVACGVENAGLFEQGCIVCGSGKPGEQVRRPGEILPVATIPLEPVPKLQQREAPLRMSPAEQLRRRPAAAIDYAEIERIVVRALENRLGGGYTDVERGTLYAALECYITLWEEGTIEPTDGLTLDGTRQLAARLLPEEGIPAMEQTHATPSATATETATSTRTSQRERATEARSAPDPDDLSDEYSDADQAERGDLAAPAAPAAPIVRRRHPAPQLVDADPRGDQGGEDDAPRHGG